MIAELTHEFPDLTRATRVKNLLARQKHRQNQTRQPTATPRRVASKTSALTRRKTPKTHGRQNAAKESAARSADTASPQHSARQASLRDRRISGPSTRSRATQTSTDVETSKTAQPAALPTPRKRRRRTRPSTASSEMLRRDGAAERRSPTRSAKPRTRKSRRVRRRLPRHERDG